MITNNPQTKRSSTYRTVFINSNPGIHGYYLCAFCGRIIKKEKMEVDHVISVNLAQRKTFYRWMLRGKNINATDNLVSACRKCNRKKTNHGGLWIFRGKIGPKLQPVLWIMFLLALTYYTGWFWITKPYLYFI